MKSYVLLRLAAVSLALGGALLVAPRARAQSEISPDHFDGTDSWARALAAKDKTAKTNLTAGAAGVNPAQKQSAELRQSAQPKARGDVAQVQPAKLVAVEKKRQTSAAKPKE